MSIRNRIDRLEKEEGRCPECKDAPPIPTAVYPGDPEPDPKHCSECGRSLGVVLRVVYEEAVEPDYPSGA